MLRTQRIVTNYNNDDFNNYVPNHDSDETVTRNVFDLNLTIDNPELESVDIDRTFFDTPCCRQKCSDQFPKNEILETRLDCLAMKYNCDSHVNHHHIYLKGKQWNLVFHYLGYMQYPA